MSNNLRIITAKLVYSRLVRNAAVVLAALTISLFLTSASLAQEATWPIYPLDGHKFPNNEYGRGPGGYLSIFSIVLYWLVFLVWIKAVDWVNKDIVRVKMPYAIWNPVVFFPFLIGFFIFALGVPYIGFPTLLLSLVVPVGLYVFMRNKQVSPDERVLTPDHLRHVFAGKARQAGVKIDTEKKFDYQKGAPVEFTALGAADDQANQANLIRSRQSPGYMVAKEVVAEALDRGAEKVMLDYTQQAVGVKHQIDGVWHDAAPRDREGGDLMLAVLKTIANLNAAERAARQDGQFGAQYKDKNYVCQFSSQGVQTGERAVVSLGDTKVQIESLEAAGMRAKMLEQLKEVLGGSTGLTLVSSMPAGGMTTGLNLLLKALDRYMRDFYIVEDPAHAEPEVENIAHVPYDAAAGQAPADVLVSLFRKEPDVIVVPNLSDAKSIGMLCEQALEDSVVIGTIRAKDAGEALLRVLMLKVPANQFAPAVKAVLNMRLIRKLCENCRQPYAPDAALLQKLGIPAGKVQALYRPPAAPEDPKDICPQCQGIGYQGARRSSNCCSLTTSFAKRSSNNPSPTCSAKSPAPADSAACRRKASCLWRAGLHRCRSCSAY